MDKEPASTFSPGSLFSDDRRAIVREILEASLQGVEASYCDIYEKHVPLAHFLRDLGVPLPKVIRTAAEFALNSRLRIAFADEEMDLDRVSKLLEEAKAGGIALDSTTLEFTLRQTIERLFFRFAKKPADTAAVERLQAVVELARSLPFEVVLWTPQNIWWDVRRTFFAENHAAPGDQAAQAWAQRFQALGEKLGLRVNGHAAAPAG